MPPHLHYCEPYFGGGAVLFARDPERDWFIDDAWKLANGDKVPSELRGCSEVANDIDRELMNFWDVLRDDALFEQLVRKVEATPFSEEMFNASLLVARHPLSKSPVSRAYCFFIRYRQSRQGLGKDFATLSRNRTRRGMNEQASSWLSAIEGLPEAHERLKRVVILNGDALDAIRQQDDPRTHFYCDPPYLHETRTATDCYEHEMTEDDHFRLLRALSIIKGTFQLSGYHSGVYNGFAKRHGWRCVEFDLPNNASGRKTKERKTECLWMNY
ncbi:MAG TPA: DNA adenine methylase [Planctomycetota bacterium]|nr:DNA adenine methylase [Planctomycetota bacterium]